jgi:hypothetical protein
MLPDEVVQSFPEDIRQSPSFEKFNDVGSLAKSYVEMEKLQGRSVAIPSNDPKDVEAWKAQHLPKLQHVFADRLPPAKPDDYEFKFEGADAEAIKSDKTLAVFREQAHKLGLSKAQASGLVETFAKDILPALFPKSDTPPLEFIQGEHVDALMQEIFKGESTQRIAEYKQSVDLLSHDIPELKDLLNEGAAPYGQASEHKAMALGDHPAMVKLIGLVAKMTQPDFGGNANAFSSPDGKAAALEAQDIIRNKENPKYKLYHNGDADVTAYVESLMKKGYPGTLEI